MISKSKKARMIRRKGKTDRKNARRKLAYIVKKGD